MQHIFTVRGQLSCVWLWDVFELVKITDEITFNVAVDSNLSREAVRGLIANRPWHRGEPQNGVRVGLCNGSEIDCHEWRVQLDIDRNDDDEGDGYVSGYGYHGQDFTARSLLKDADKRCNAKYEHIILTDVID